MKTKTYLDKVETLSGEEKTVVDKILSIVDQSLGDQLDSVYLFGEAVINKEHDEIGLVVVYNDEVKMDTTYGVKEFKWLPDKDPITGDFYKIDTSERTTLPNWNHPDGNVSRAENDLIDRTRLVFENSVVADGFNVYYLVIPRINKIDVYLNSNKKLEKKWSNIDGLISTIILKTGKLILKKETSKVAETPIEQEMDIDIKKKVEL